MICSIHNREYTDFCYDCYSNNKRNAKIKYWEKRSTIIVKNCIKCFKEFDTNLADNYPMCYGCFLKWSKGEPITAGYSFIDDD